MTATRRCSSLGTRQPPRRRRAQRQRQLGGQLTVGDSANTVGAEQSTHADKPPTLMGLGPK